MPGKIKSKAQARLFGAIAGGGKVKGVKVSVKKAKEMLKGEKLKKLPGHVKKKK